MMTFWLALAAKMATSALLVTTACLLVERTGPVIGALIATLPLSAGPAWAFLALEHGPEFVAAGTLVSLSANIATAVFIAAYVRLAQRLRTAAALGGAVASWIATVWLLRQLDWTFAWAVAANLAAYLAAMASVRPFLSPPGGLRPVAGRWDIPVRVVAVASLVGAVVIAGRLLGPAAAGIAALFPVVLTSLAGLLQPRLGGPAVAAVIGHTLPGMIGFVVALATLHAAVLPLGSGPALLLALAIAIGWNVGLLLRRQGRVTIRGTLSRLARR